MSNITVDSKWITKNGPQAGISAKVVSIHVADGKEWVTYEQKVKGGYATTVKTMDAVGFRYWYKSEPDFFVTGRTYKYTWASSTYSTYHVQETYQVSKPVGTHARLAARAVCINSRDKREMVMLDIDDFQEMVEITS